MKFLYCRSPLCQDAVKLQRQDRTCKCGKCSGKLNDDMRSATITGRYAEVLEMNDTSLLQALKSPDLEPTVFGIGPVVKAFIWPHNADMITRKL